MDDHELLQQYAQNRSQDAFRTLVERHLPMVYGAACRLSRNPHLAEDVAQKVFITLAKKSSSISSGQVLAGWIYNTTRYVALQEMRTEQRRQEREQTALTMQDLAASSEPDKIMEQLEPALSELDEDDRGALVLRYLENRSLREVGAELRISEDAARMRVNRALEKLRNIFGRQGMNVTVVMLTATLATTSTKAVPLGLIGTITATTTTSATLMTMTWINAKTIAAVLCSSLLAGTGVYLAQQRHINQLQAENRDLVTQTAKLNSEQRASLAQIAAEGQELQQTRKNTRELAQLRSEVGKLRQEHQSSNQTAAKAASVKSLSQEALSPGTYISKDQLAFAGYKTPEAALLTTTYAMMNGKYEMAMEGLDPAEAKNNLKDPKDRERFEQGYKQMASLFIGFQIIAKKTLTSDKVELKVKMDATNPDPKHPMPEFMVQPMTLFGEDWKLGGSTRSMNKNWSDTGDIQTYAP